jgi:catechol 2,3-dioxygenase
VTEHIHDLARIGHAELLTPKPEESLRFFGEVLGMEEVGRQGESVYLRAWGDYLRYSLKLTESPLPGLGHVALRAWSPGARPPGRGRRGDGARDSAGSTET